MCGVLWYWPLQRMSLRERDVLQHFIGEYLKLWNSLWIPLLVINPCIVHGLFCFVYTIGEEAWGHNTLRTQRPPHVTIAGDGQVNSVFGPSVIVFLCISMAAASGCALHLAPANRGRRVLAPNSSYSRRGLRKTSAHHRYSLNFQQVNNVGWASLATEMIGTHVILFSELFRLLIFELE